MRTCDLLYCCWTCSLTCVITLLCTLSSVCLFDTWVCYVFSLLEFYMVLAIVCVGLLLVGLFVFGIYVLRRVLLFLLVFVIKDLLLT